MDDGPKSRFRFGIRTLFEIITVAAFVLALIYGRLRGGENGRYQMHVTHHQVRGDTVYVLDGKTGRLWRQDSATGQWRQEGNPVPEVSE